MLRRTAVMLTVGFWAATLHLAGSLNLRAQEPGEQIAPAGGARGQFAGMQRAVGTVTTVNGATLVIKSIESGEATTVVTTANTRVMRQGAPAALSDLKPGEGAMAMGQLDAPNKTLHAAMLMEMTADQTAQMEKTAAELKANLGKTYIVGKVTAIDLDTLKMSVERPDGQVQTIGFDEGTSFKRGGRVEGVGGLGGGFGGRRGASGGQRGAGSQTESGSGAVGADQRRPGSGATDVPVIVGGESITLGDVKVGDAVTGLGALKSGTFVPTTLNVQVRGEGGSRRRGGASGQPATPGGATTPSGSEL